MAEKRDFYEVLGVSKDASADEIKKAYRKITKENHPDLHPGDKACEERFKEANEAYEILSDEDKRKKYDQYGMAAFDPNAGAYGGGFGGFGGFDVGDLSDLFGGFGDIFGGFGGSRRANPNAPRKGSDVRASVNISFEEAAFGCEKEITVPIIEQCRECGGNGCEKGTTPEVCPDCNGSGQTVTQQRTPFGMMQSTGQCARCGGTGKIIHQPCKSCKGMGNIRRQHKLSVKIPAGIDDGQRIPLRGKGNAGSNGGPAGDIYVSVIVRPHAVFERDGATVYLNTDISYAEAVLGADIEVPTLDGKVKLTIPEGTQPGAVFRLKGKGIPYLNGKGARGDQFITVGIAVPKKLNSEQKDLLRKFAEATGTSSTLKGGLFGKKKQ